MAKFFIQSLTLILFATSGNTEIRPSRDWLFVHTAAKSEIQFATTLIMSIDIDLPATDGEPNSSYGYLTPQAFASLWHLDEENEFKVFNPQALLIWVDGENMKSAEITIMSAKTTNKGQDITYTIRGQVGDFSGPVPYASLFIDASDNGVCAFSILNNALIEGLTESLYFGAGIASLDCLLSDFFSIILNPAAHHGDGFRSSSGYGHVFYAKPN